MATDINDERYQLAKSITDRLMGAEAPLHLKSPQISELESLNLDQLRMISMINDFPINRELREKIISLLGSERIITRMERRYVFAKAIAEAEREGRYEAAEHATGMLDLT